MGGGWGRLGCGVECAQALYPEFTALWKTVGSQVAPFPSPPAISSMERAPSRAFLPRSLMVCRLC